MEVSGDVSRSRVMGSSLLYHRQALWQWVFTRIEPRRVGLKNEIGKTLGNFLDAEKATGKPVKLMRSRTCLRSVKLLFKELTRAFVTQNVLE